MNCHVILTTVKLCVCKLGSICTVFFACSMISNFPRNVLKFVIIYQTGVTIVLSFFKILMLSLHNTVIDFTIIDVRSYDVLTEDSIVAPKHLHIFVKSIRRLTTSNSQLKFTIFMHVTWDHNKDHDTHYLGTKQTKHHK